MILLGGHSMSKQPVPTPRTSVSLREAHDPLVLALDIGSTASRARVFDATGAPLRGLRHRIPHTITTRADGAAEIDPAQVLGEVTNLIDALTAERRLAQRIAGVAMDTFASSLVGVDAGDRPLTPCYTYADARPAAEVAALRAELNEASVQERTGTRFHSGYLPARFRWLAATLPDAFAGAVRWLSLGEFVYAHLIGRYAASYSTAAWTGLLDRRTATWDPILLGVCGVRLDQLSPLHDTTAPLTDAGAQVATRWPALARATWFPAVTDGYASNVGSGATDAGSAALAAGTSGALRVLVPDVPADVPGGLWCYRVDRGHSLLGGALNDVGRVLTWLRGHLQLPDDAGLNTAMLAPPIDGTPAVLPFLTGERSPGWAANAHAAIADITDAVPPLTIARAAMEAVALRYALIAEQLAAVAPDATRVIASGGVTEVLPGWLQIVADTLGRPVVRAVQRQATLRGTALIALDVLAPDVPRSAVALGETYEPAPAHAAYYQTAAARQQALYAALIAPHHES